jgi:GTP-binding protein HflX
MSVVLKPEQAKLRVKLFQVAQILKEENRDDGCWVIELNISNKYKHLLTTI